MTRASLVSTVLGWCFLYRLTVRMILSHPLRLTRLALVILLPVHFQLYEMVNSVTSYEWQSSAHAALPLEHDVRSGHSLTKY